MRIITMVLALILSPKAWSNGKVFLDLEDGQIVSIFNMPGKNWKNCESDPNCRAVAWPDNKAQIEVTSPPKKVQVEDLYTGKIVEEEFVQVNYNYNRTVNGRVFNQEGSGWIDSAYISKQRKDSFYGPTTTGKSTEDNCLPVSKGSDSGKMIPKSLEALEKTLGHKSVTEAAEAIKPLVGSCVIDPKSSKEIVGRGNPFDTYVLPDLLRRNAPPLLKENGQKMTQKDLIDIDALARTLYAEMASCYKNGLHYPMTVAKIALNRAGAKDRHREFIKAPQASEKGDLAKAVTSPSQFSLWLTKIDGKRNNSLRQALCPPSQKTKPFWTGAPPPDFETNIWENTLRIATEAVLFPKKFKSRTEGVKQFHYTSGRGEFFRMKQVFPWIEERKISKNSCLEVWDDGSRG